MRLTLCSFTWANVHWPHVFTKNNQLPCSGHSIRDGARIPAETGLGTVNAIASKAELIVRGDTDGNINIWNIKDRQSKNIHTGEWEGLCFKSWSVKLEVFVEC